MESSNGWTNVKSKKEKRLAIAGKHRHRNCISIAARTTALDSTSQGTHQVKRHGQTPPHRASHVSAHRSLNRALCPKNWHDLANQDPECIIVFLCRNWNNVKALLTQKGFENIITAFAKVLATLAKSNHFSDAQFVLLAILERVNLHLMNETCHSIDLFASLCVVYEAFADRGDSVAKKCIHAKKWVLIAIGEATKMTCDHNDGERVLAKLQELDCHLSPISPLTSTTSATEPTRQKSFSAVVGRKRYRRADVNAEAQPSRSTSTMTNNVNQDPHQAIFTHANEKWPEISLEPNESTFTRSQQAGQPHLKAKTNTLQRKKYERNGQAMALGTKSKVQSVLEVRTGRKNTIAPRYHDEYTQKRTKTTTKFSENGLLVKSQKQMPVLEFSDFMRDAMELISWLKVNGTKQREAEFLSNLCTDNIASNIAKCLDSPHKVSTEFFDNVTNLCLTFFKVTPNLFRRYFRDTVIHVLAKAIKKSDMPTTAQTKKYISDLRAKLMQPEYESSEPPLVGFRDMFVSPTAEDFVCSKVHLRPNIVKGAYKSEEEYLDIQFRLLREDFMKPLRDGLAEMRGQVNALQPDEEKFSGVRLYKNVTFEKADDRRFRSYLVMKFNRNNDLNNINWLTSKRFMLGALLVISMDNFTTLHLAKIAYRDVNSMSSGSVLVEPFGTDNWEDLLVKGNVFVVAESLVFFEPYFHVLTALQNTSASNFPLTRYIVYADPAKELPDYLAVPENRKYVLPLKTAGNELVWSNAIDVVQDEWPSSEEMGLNEVQQEALFGCLTQKVMLVQGPPGTGKTFLGLRVVSTLLQNSHAWSDGSQPGPILIVCLTNHALDQFLIGLSKTTDSIVRLGGRCKDERLEKYLLPRNEESLSANLREELRKRKRTTDAAKNDLLVVRAAFKAVDKNIGIVSFKTFLKYNVVDKKYCTALAADFSVTDWLSLQPQATLLQEKEHMYCLDSKEMIVTFEETLYHMKCSIRELERYQQDENVFFQNQRKADILEARESRLRYFREHIDQNESQSRERYPVELQSDDLQVLSEAARWEMYWLWIHELRLALLREERKYEKRVKDCEHKEKQVRFLKDQEVIARKLVLGMTTTKAAQMQPLLQALKPKIVVVEEAAEVLESHIIAALTHDVQHLILLGDHKQLRPSPGDNVMATEFKLEISLFERLCNNNMPCKTLNVQHRMRPEIASLLTSIYPDLKNHISVHNYPHITGLENDVFFVDHMVPEQWQTELMSYCNPHEARFLAALVRYLIMQGYKENKITILTAYAGQLMYIKGLEYEYPDLRKVRVCNIDNFQGEESDIILLSLVRSNPANSIGFLATENRVCVALSRAKHGMIMVGNLQGLCAKSKTWSFVKKVLQRQKAVGRFLTLTCIRHPSEKLNVKWPADFEKWRDGGCTMPCPYNLPCGHKCQEKCHRNNETHIGKTCTAICNQLVCNKDHRPYYCTKMCYEQCEPCGADKYVTLSCGHMAKMRCAKDPSTFQCRRKIKRVLEPCKHENLIFCYRNGPCRKPCAEELSCHHKCSKDCHLNDDPNHEEYKCHLPCMRTPPGCTKIPPHGCNLRCADPCRPCDVLINKSLPCYHNMRLPCSEPATKELCRAKCPRKRTCKHQCRRPCGQECGDCDVEVLKKHPICSHLQLMPCSSDIEQCTSPCEKQLPCTHACKGVCGQSCPPCKVQVERTRPDCGHPISVACSADSTAIKNACSDPCLVKVRKLLSACHHEVDLPCSANAEQAQCSERCGRSLSCGHACRGRCGEPCGSTPCCKPVKRKSKCGHLVRLPCHEAQSLDDDSVLEKCREACRVKLVCGHPCKGNCFECFQGRVHRFCEENCTRLLVCGHRCVGKCGDPCLPCSLKCPVKCAHSTCEKLCGQTCNPCQEQCKLAEPGRVFKCNRKCRDFCSWEPSNEPCRFPVRKCKMHDCIGFYGDLCPPGCRICDSNEADFREAAPDARFVLLQDCGHTVQSEDIRRAFQNNSSVVRTVTCPKCGTPITNTSRYGNQTKQILKYVIDIYKELSLLDSSRLDKQKAELKKRQANIKDCPNTSHLRSKLMKAIEETQKNYSSQQLRYTDNRILARTVRTLCTYAGFVCMMMDCLRSCRNVRRLGQELTEQVEGLAGHIVFQKEAISEQQVNDITGELLRIFRLYQLGEVEETLSVPVLQEDVDYRQVSKGLRSSGPYLHKTLDDGVHKIIVSLQQKQSKPKAGVQWWQPTHLPLSAAQGFWYICKAGHVYSKTGTDRTCLKCPSH